MKKVDLLNKMRILKDKNLYFDCSDDLKQDFDFITEVIKIFRDDFDFIDEVAESYVKYLPVDELESHPEYLELCILLGQFVTEEHQCYGFYTERLNYIYELIILNAMLLKDKCLNASNLGFSLIENKRGDRPNVMDYIAKRFTESLFRLSSAGTFEDLVHKNSMDFDGISEMGYDNFFIRNLYNADEALSYYIFKHPYLLDDLKFELDEISDNWDNYEEELSNKCVSIIREWVAKAAEECAYGDDFSYGQVMNELLISLNLGNLFGLDKRDVLSRKSRIISFSIVSFKKDLKAIIDKVLFERLTLTELNSLSFNVLCEQEKKLVK